MITLVNIKKSYGAPPEGVTALHDVSLEIERGEFVAIVGTSGSGKTTLLHLLGALDVPTSGMYFLDGERLDNIDDAELSARRNRSIGFVFQHFNLLRRATALENVLTPGLYSDRPVTTEQALTVMDRVGIAHRHTHYPAQMSGGEQQRVAIARALIMQPALLLADEPTGNLDATTSEQIMGVLEELHRDGLTIVLVTHDPAVAERAQRVLTIRDGAVVSDVRRASHLAIAG